MSSERPEGNYIFLSPNTGKFKHGFYQMDSIFSHPNDDMPDTPLTIQVATIHRRMFGTEYGTIVLNFSVKEGKKIVSQLEKEIATLEKVPSTDAAKPKDEAEVVSEK